MAINTKLTPTLEAIYQHLREKYKSTEKITIAWNTRNHDYLGMECWRSCAHIRILMINDFTCNTRISIVIDFRQEDSTRHSEIRTAIDLHDPDSIQDLESHIDKALQCT